MKGGCSRHSAQWVVTLVIDLARQRGNLCGMARLMLTYGAALAVLALLVDWIGWQHTVLRWSTPAYVVAVAFIFAGLGIWMGLRLVPRARSTPFARNDQALMALGISPREAEVLSLVAEGASNKVIARQLAISPNTVKTHLARLFEKLEASSRTEAIHKARRLELLP